MEEIMGHFSTDYLRLAAEQGMLQNLICLPSMPPQDVISLQKDAAQET